MADATKITGPSTVVAKDDTDQPMVEAKKSPNLNKTTGSAAGGVSGGLLGVGIVALLHLYKPDLSPELSATVAGVVTAVLGAVGTFMAPLVTAAQAAALRRLEH